MKNSVIIIPTFNEKENISLMIYAILNHYKETHIAVVDDNSPDGTAAIVKDLILEFPDRLYLLKRHKKGGLGTAYIHGFKWAIERDYDFIFEMDADFSHDPRDLIRLYNACNTNFDIAIGSRYVNGVNVVNWPMSRVLLSYIASKYVRFITRIPIHDTTAGFVCYNSKILRKINLDSIKFVGYAFQIEMKFKAWLLKAKIVEIPVIFTDRARGKSKMNGNIIHEAIFGVLKMKLYSLFGELKV